MINASIVCKSIDNFGSSKDRVIKFKGDMNLSDGTPTAKI